MVQRPTIRHFLAMVTDNRILEEQGRGSFKDLTCPFFLKSTLFTNSGRGKPLIMLPPSSSRIKMVVAYVILFIVVLQFSCQLVAKKLNY